MPDLTADYLLPLSLGTIGALLGGVSLVLPLRARLPATLSLLAPLLLVVALWWQQSPARSNDRLAGSATRADYRIELCEVGAVTALTDLGRRVRLAALARPVPYADLSGVEDDHIRTHELSRKVIARTDPDPSHNCHGWVFTGGRYWVAGKDVDAILADNRYARTASPAPGDLAVYRGVEGVVVHTGIVYSAADCTLVESKWGPLGADIHAPQDQPFGGARARSTASPGPATCCAGCRPAMTERTGIKPLAKAVEGLAGRPLRVPVLDGSPQYPPL